MKILLSGGGTLGPVTPLLALAEKWREMDATMDLVWVGTVNGPEVHLISGHDIRYISIASVKFPRYFSFYWFAIPFLALYALIESWNVIKKERPDVIVTAGGYVSVPLVVLGKFMGVKSWVHQQDVRPGLANNVMSRFAEKVSVTFESSAALFPQKKVVVTGNAVRESIQNGSRSDALKKFGLSKDRKTLLVLGGGSGSNWINRSMSAIADNMVDKWQVLHVAGRDKLETVLPASHNYTVEPLIGEGMDDAYAVADVVLCRAGLGTITELSAVGKPMIVVPIPGTHQEDNAFFLFEHQAALILDQTETTPQVLLSAIRSVMDDEDVQLRLAANLKLSFPKDGTDKIANGVLEVAQLAASSWNHAETRENEDIVSEPEYVVEAVKEGDQPDEREVEAIESIEEQIRRALGGNEPPAEKSDDEPFETHEVNS
jgi:UDP-N-acetylglucosamine--N-acetylmuramyl-(pentapeptide) pyrophosphoryl-undecaprenol N-acetylglucosamine transferase